MGRKIFVSYKYKDSDVQMLSMPGIMQPTWVSDYVEYIRKYIFFYFCKLIVYISDLYTGTSVQTVMWVF